jgi:alpha-1,3/alpha-1,6-mannosyltransferase
MTNVGMSDRILVNSEYTGRMYKETFPHLHSQIAPTVVYPGINLARYDTVAEVKDKSQLEGIEALRYCFSPLCFTCKHGSQPWWDRSLPSDIFVFLSINRFERKKGIDLAIRAYAVLLNHISMASKLFIAGISYCLKTLQAHLL